MRSRSYRLCLRGGLEARYLLGRFRRDYWRCNLGVLMNLTYREKVAWKLYCEDRNPGLIMIAIQIDVPFRDLPGATQEDFLKKADKYIAEHPF